MGVQHSHVAAWTAALCHYKPVVAEEVSNFTQQPSALNQQTCNSLHWTLWLSLNHNDLGTVTVKKKKKNAWISFLLIRLESRLEVQLVCVNTTSIAHKKQTKTAGFNITVTVLPWGYCWTVWTRPARSASNLLVKHDYMNQRCSVYNVQNETWKLTRVIWQHCSCVCSSLVKEKLAVRPRTNPGKNRKTNSFSY